MAAENYYICYEKEIDKMETSFTSASAFPAKLLRKNVISENGKIEPVHLQISPTNKCTLNCSFCSCSAREKETELSLEDIKTIMSRAHYCGTRAVTITGGGEPLCHPNIKEIFTYINSLLMISIGLVTNGTLVHKLSEEDWRKITWCRISSADFRNFDDKYAARIQAAVDNGPNVDWAFSHVVGYKPNYDTIKSVIKFANANNFTHVRLVSDLLDLDNVPPMSLIKEKIRGYVDCSKVIFQERKDSTPGTKKCLISLLKPVVGTNGMLYPCCGTQYAQAKPGRDFGGDDMTMGEAKDIVEIYDKQKNFDGSVCKTCYYSNYNWALDIMTSEMEHIDWVLTQKGGFHG